MYKLPDEGGFENVARQLVPINEVEPFEVEYLLDPDETDIEPGDLSLHDQYVSLLMVDTVLFDAVNFMTESWVPEEYTEDFIDGAMVTYRLFSHQADNRAVLIPKMDEDIADVFFRNIPSFSDFRDYLMPIVSELEITDKFFYNSLNTYMENIEDQLEPQEKTAFLFGAYALYDFLRNQFEQLDLKLEQEIWDREHPHP